MRPPVRALPPALGHPTPARSARPAALAALLLAAATLVGCPASTPAPACPAGQTSCGGLCFDLQSDAGSCGTCLHRCATGASCQAGTCTCPAALPDLCGWPSGQCVDLATDDLHCGDCSVACGLGACAGGACACDVGATSCPGPGTRCVDPLTDTGNCGACRNGCATGQSCSGGACLCLAPRLECGGACVDPRTDERHCGACGATCALGATCTAGVCACPAGQTDCAGTCRALATDPLNCGACGARCASGASCTGGACACPGGQVTCGGAPGTCADLASDPLHCGTCTTTCAAGEACTLGTCCGAGLLACSVGAAKACCAGTTCCAGGCQTAHSNGLGQTYYDCGALRTYTQAAAQLAAGAWSPAGGLDSGQFCAGNCYARATANAAATWCYDGLFAGRVELNTISIAPLCPTSASPGWD